jgi:hypothetical protein
LLRKDALNKQRSLRPTETQTRPPPSTAMSFARPPPLPPTTRTALPASIRRPQLLPTAHERFPQSAFDDWITGLKSKIKEGLDGPPPPPPPPLPSIHTVLGTGAEDEQEEEMESVSEWRLQRRREKSKAHYEPPSVAPTATELTEEDEEEDEEYEVEREDSLQVGDLGTWPRQGDPPLTRL